MGGTSSNQKRQSSDKSIATNVFEQRSDSPNTAELIRNIKAAIKIADDSTLQTSQFMEVMFDESVDNCSSRGRALLQNCINNLVHEKAERSLSVKDFDDICELVLDGIHDMESASPVGKDFRRRIQSDRQLVRMLFLENNEKPNAEVVEDILLLAYSASTKNPVISGQEENFATKLAQSMVKGCDSIDALLLLWERTNLPIAYSCRAYFAQRLIAVSTSSEDAINCGALLTPEKPDMFPSPIGSFGMWLLTEMLPPAYSPPLPPLEQKLAPFTQWQILFDSYKDGLSFSRLESLVFDYKSPTLILLSFSDNLFAVGIDCEWRRGVLKWGDAECCLYQLTPTFHLIESNPGMIIYNTKDRSVPKGMQFGSKFVHLEIDEGLTSVKLYGVPVSLDWVQVIGCGTKTALNAQMEYRRLTTEDARRLKDKKLHADDWGVDTKILDWGGVQRGNLAKNYGIDNKNDVSHVEGRTSSTSSSQ